MGDYKISEFCDAITNGEITMVCNIGNGSVVKAPTECWNAIKTYIDDYSVDEICNATADEEDRLYMKDLFEAFINKGILIDHDENTILSVDLALTNRCNLRCVHCCVDSDLASTSDKLSTEDWKRTIDKVLLLNPDSVVITGGEPMIRDDFFEITEYLRERFNGHMNLMTNGLFINESNVKKLIEMFAGFNISVDGYDEETCSLIRGKGVFGRVMNVVELLKQNGVPSKHIALSMVETQYTQGKTYLFDELNDKLGTNSVVRAFSPLGRGEINRKKLEIIEEGMNDTNVKETELPVCQSCAAGRRKFSINSVGDIYPCLLLEKEPFCMGNVKDIDDLKEFFENKLNRSTKGFCNLERLMPQKRKECEDCNVRPFCVHCYPDFERYVDREDFPELCRIQKEALQYIWEV